MKKLLYVLIIILIFINTYLFYIDKPDSEKDEKYNLLLINDNHENEELGSSLDDFEKIDKVFIDKNFDKKWIYTKKTDSLWFKYIKAPDTYSLARYNLFFQKILRNNNIVVKKVTEYELSNKLVFNFTIGDSIPATVELRVTRGLESDLNLSGSICVIMNAMGDNWGQEWIKDILASPMPLTISILPERWASSKVYQESVKNNKEILISLPMEPEIGNIDKEKLKILSGMNNFTIDVILDKLLVEIPETKGIINYKGSKLAADYETMDVFFKSFEKRRLIYIENLSGIESYSELLCNEYNIPYFSSTRYFETRSSLENNFQNVVDDVFNGNDALIVIEATEENYGYLTKEIFEKYPELNYLLISQYTGQIK